MWTYLGNCVGGSPATIWRKMLFLFELLFFPYISNKLRSQRESCLFSTSGTRHRVSGNIGDIDVWHGDIGTRLRVSGNIGDLAVGITKLLILEILVLFPNLSRSPFGNCLPGTELCLSPFRTEFSMGSLSRRYQRLLRRHRWYLWSYGLFLRSYRQSLQRRDPCIGGRSVAEAVIPIIARLTKHHKTWLSMVKLHETLVEHCPVLNFLKLFFQ